MMRLSSPSTLACMLLAISVSGCREEAPPPVADPAPQPATMAAPDTPEEIYAAAIEEAHGAEAWRAAEAVAADFVIEFGGNKVLAGWMQFRPDFSGSRIETEDGSVAIWDGETAWVAPADSALERVRFHVLTWPYFLAAPMKLRDPGTRLEILGERPLAGVTHEVARLTFEPGIGDTPEDWYLTYRDPVSERLAAMAYVVTYGTPLEKAEEEPHAITYEDYEEVDGVAVPMTWNFWMWNEEDGIYGEPIGRIALSNVSFDAPSEGAFTPPAEAREERLPSSG